jgi:AcrR family transcriptional regulator
VVARKTQEQVGGLAAGGHGDRPVRADAQRNIDRLLQTALAVFATSGVDAPMREIAEKAGVGVGTVYRHFPRRSDLIAAVFRREIDACAQAARTLSAERESFDALVTWMEHFVDFVATKRGFAAALYSGDSAYDELPAYLDRRLRPALQSLLDAAAASGHLCVTIKPNELLRAAASLCTPARDVGPDHARRMVGLLLDGLRYGATKPAGR